MNTDYVYEFQSQKTNNRNYQERYLHVPSWDIYIEALLNNGIVKINGKTYETNPHILTPENFKLIETSAGLFYGTFHYDRFPEKGDFIHLAKTVNKENIPYDVYIIELELIKR